MPIPSRAMVGWFAGVEVLMGRSEVVTRWRASYALQGRRKC